MVEKPPLCPWNYHSHKLDIYLISDGLRRDRPSAGAAGHDSKDPKVEIVKPLSLRQGRSSGVGTNSGGEFSLGEGERRAMKESLRKGP